MNISGFVPVSFVDYPDHMCSTIFTSGCQFRCPFCHNGDIVINNDNNLDTKEILDSIINKSKLIKYICISGGEPLIQSDIEDFINELNKYDIKIKLDTNGYNYDKLNSIIHNCRIDYIAMDIKNIMYKYNKTVGKDTNIDNINNSINIIMKSGIPYEFRTTMVKGLHDIEDAILIAKWIHGADKYVIQNYKYSENVINPESLESFDRESLENIVDNINEKGYVKKCILNTFN